MKKYLLFFFPALIFFISCKKFGHGYVKGNVLEAGSGQPVQNATVIFRHWKSNCSSCPYLYDSVFTDSRGGFVIYFKRQVNHEYALRVRDNKHYDYQRPDIIWDKKNDLEISLAGFAYIRFRIKKMSASRLDVSVNGGGYGFGFFYAHDDSPIDTLLPKVTKVRAGETLQLNWEILQTYPNTPQSTTYHDQVTIDANDTLTYTITYN